MEYNPDKAVVFSTCISIEAEALPLMCQLFVKAHAAAVCWVSALDRLLLGLLIGGSQNASIKIDFCTHCFSPVRCVNEDYQTTGSLGPANAEGNPAKD